MNWIIIIILLILVFAFLKMRHIKHKFIAIFIIILLIFFYTSASSLFSGQNIDWKSFSGLEKASHLYFSWLANSFSNLKSLTGNAVKMDWQPPVNETGK